MTMTVVRGRSGSAGASEAGSLAGAEGSAGPMPSRPPMSFLVSKVCGSRGEAASFESMTFIIPYFAKTGPPWFENV